MKNNYFNLYLLILFEFIFIVNNCVAFDFNLEISNEVNDNSTAEDLISSYRNYRLPNTTKPISYDIDLFTEIHKGIFNFSGIVNIHLKVLIPTDAIVLNAKHLSDFQIKLTALNDRFEFPSLNYTYDPETELLKIYSENEVLDLEADEEYLLNISYKGVLNSDHTGFFRTFYKDWKDENIWLAATQFEPTDARHGFPCYDEPALKATFSISITYGSNYTAISNMPVISSENLDNDLIKTKFQNSPLMSTYLVAFVISNFQSISGQNDGNNFTQRVFSRPGTKSDCNFALDTTLRTIKKLEEYFDVPLAVPKMDHIGIPNASIPAMENWGLIIYREKVLLVNRETPSRTLLDIVNVIAHEYSHQLFGNFVTPKWWTWTWLSEGFASFYSQKMANMLFPEWNINDFYFLTSNTYNLGRYSYPRRPITSYVESPKEVMEVFDSVSYYKACAVLRMFESTIGEETFRKGIKYYLHKFQYSSADEDNLFECIEQAVYEDNTPIFSENDTMRKFMKSWTNQILFPVVTINRNYENGTIDIYQEIYSDDNDNESKNSSELWWISMNFATASEPNFESTATDILVPQIDHFIIDENSIGHEITNDDWLIANKQRTGLYLVNYDEQNWKLISNGLRKNPTIIHRYNRAYLLRDAFTLFNSGKLSIEIFLELFSYLKYENDEVVWASLDDIFYEFIYIAQVIPEFKMLLQDLVRPIFMKIGYDDNETDSHMLKVSRERILRIACTIDLKECLKKSNEKLKKIRETGIESDKNYFVYCCGLREVDEDDFEYFLNRMIWTDCPKEREKFINLFNCIRRPELFEKLFNSTLDRSTLTKYTLKDRLNVFEWCDSCVAINTSLNFLSKHYKELENLFSLGSGSSSSKFFYKLVIQFSFSGVCNKVQENQLRSLINLTQIYDYMSDDEMEIVENNLKINYRLEWMTKHKEKLVNWLSTNIETNAATVPAILASKMNKRSFLNVHNHKIQTM